MTDLINSQKNNLNNKKTLKQQWRKFKMTKNDIIQKVNEIIAESLDVELEEVTPEASLTEDIGADSLELVDLTMDFEDEFDVKIESAELAEINTVGEITGLLLKKLELAA
jgi:acyl carrier protein